jgi:hypothetical protein
MIMARSKKALCFNILLKMAYLGALFVIPVKTGIQYQPERLDSRLRGNDGK